MAEHAPRPVVSEANIEDFERDGFVVVPDLLTPSELDRFTPAVVEAVASWMARNDRTDRPKSLYEQSFLQCINLWEESTVVRELTMHQRIAEAAARLLRAEAVRLWHDQALFKEAGGRVTDTHQDQPYWPIAEPQTITAWVPLDGADLVNGCLGYVPGSHRIGLRRFVDIFSGNPQELLDDPAIKGIEPVFREVPRGSVAFHHGLTAHRAKPNLSNRVRRVHTMIYFADGCTRGSDMAHFAVDRANIAVGDAIVSEITPMVWSAR